MELNTLQAALRLVGSTPGYIEVGMALAQLLSDKRIRFDPNLEDRAQTALTGIITLGPEATESSPLSLAQTLVHEHFHTQQNPLMKTVSFWSGVATKSNVMKRYEEPAYRAAYDVLEAVKQAHPALAEEAEAEQMAVRQVFAEGFDGDLV